MIAAKLLGYDSWACTETFWYTYVWNAVARLGIIYKTDNVVHEAPLELGKLKF